MRRLSTLLCLMSLTACATAHTTLLDPSSLTISDNSKVVSADLIPEPERYPRAVTHLALAEELYQRKLALLRDRRITVRERTRTLQATSFAAFALSGIGVGAIAISNQNQEQQSSSLRSTGYVALTGLAAGTLLQVLSNMQEDPASIDAKVQRLQASHAHMVEQLRAIVAAAPPATNAPGANTGTEVQMAAAIEAFMAEAGQINVQG